MAECTDSLRPAGRPTLIRHTYSGSNFTFSFSAGSGPRSGYRLEYGPDCDHFEHVLEIGSHLTSQTIVDFPYSEKFCAKIQEFNNCEENDKTISLYGEWSNHYSSDPVASPSPSPTSTATSSADTATKAAELPVSGDLTTALTIFLLGGVILFTALGLRNLRA